MTKKKVTPAPKAETTDTATTLEGAEPSAFTKTGMPVLTPEDAAVITNADELDVVAQTDHDVISGFGDGGMEIDTAPGTAEPVVAVATEETIADATIADPVTPAVAKKTYRVGKREFASPEALAAYVEGLEQSQLDILEKIKPAAIAEPEIDLKELIFENPGKALEIIEARAKAAAEKILSDRDNVATSARKSQDTWDAFYSANPDLVGFEDTVNARFDEIRADPKTNSLSIADGMKLVADRARAKANDIKLKLKPASALSNAAAVTSGVSGAAVPNTPAPSKVLTFADEVKALRRGART